MIKWSRLSRLQDYRRTFGTDMGKRVLADIAQVARTGQTPFDPSPTTTAYHVGQHDLVKLIMSRVYGPLAPEESQKLPKVAVEEQEDQSG